VSGDAAGAARAPRARVAILVAGEATALAVGWLVGWVAALLGAAVVLVLWRFGSNLRWMQVACMLAGAFTLYTQGHLTRDLSVVCAFGALAGILGIREYRQRGWTLPRNALTTALGLWFLVTFWGMAVGLVRGNNLKYAGIDLADALALSAAILAPLWRARPRAFQGVIAAVVGVSWVSSLFGLGALLFVFHQRVGDAWFSPIPPMAALVLLSVALHAPEARTRWPCAALSVVPLANLLLSFTRAYWMGFLAALGGVVALFVWTSARRGRALVQMVWGTLVFALVAVAALGTSQFLLGADVGWSVGQRFESSFTTQASGNTISNVLRLTEWAAALDMIRRNPVVGYGAGGALLSEDPFIGFRREHPYIHEMYLFQTFKYGIPGLLALLFLFAAFGWAGVREAIRGPTWERRAMGAAAVGITVLIAVISLFDFAMTHVTAALPLAFLWGLMLPVTHPDGSTRLEWNEADR